MKIVYKDHNYIYAVEQTVATLFPGDSSVELVTSVSRGKVYTTAGCVYKGFRGFSRIRNELIDAGDESGLIQHALRTAIYRAARASGMARPPWGSLTGVRPGKLMKDIMSSAPDEKTAAEMFSARYDVTPARAALCAATTAHTLAAEKQLGSRNVCLYVGIPFCPTRCAYCSFVSQSTEKSMALIPPFLAALEKEIAAAAAAVCASGLRPVSLYIGGGTPTALSAQQLEGLFSALEREFDLEKMTEFCVEAGRPDTITAEKLSVLARHKVGRVSVNPQTMNDSVLDVIGRRHSSADIRAAYEKVRAAGGFEVNMDLIAGLPSDYADSFRRSVDEVLEMRPENITVHTLSKKRGSSLFAGGTPVPSADEVSLMLEYAYGALSRCGYEPYYLYRQKNMSGGFENTGWTLPGHDNLYNICIMEELRGVIAMGGGGSSKLISLSGGRNERIVTPKYPHEYIEQIERICSCKAKIAEFYSENK